MNDFYIRKIIKEEFAAMIAPFQIEMHSRITNVDNKVNMVTNSVAVMNNNFSNNNNNSVRISQIDNEGYEAKIKELDEKIDLLVNWKKYDIFLDLKHFFDIIVLMFFNVEEVDKNEDDFPAKEETEI